MEKRLFKHHQTQQSISTSGMTIHWARWYDWIVSLFLLGRSKKLHRLTVEWAQVQAGDSVLDIGCGTGHLTALLKTAVGESGHVIGIDAAAEMIMFAQEKYPHVGFQLAAVENLPFEDNRFDVVVSSLVLHHLPGSLKQEALREVFRVLKPNGRSVNIDFANESKGGELSRRQIEQMLRDAGFVEADSRPINFQRLFCIQGKKPTVETS